MVNLKKVVEKARGGKNIKTSSTSMEGSKFAVLCEETVEDTIVESTETFSGLHEQVPTKITLAKILNRKVLREKKNPQPITDNRTTTIDVEDIEDSKSFWFDLPSGKKCYMMSVKELYIKDADIIFAWVILIAYSLNKVLGGGRSCRFVPF
ncbi:hypothetical protein QYF36_003875 [Acer negundo]|nr:hypothetical protein QYF36_003875 [Acer negundo]